MFTGIVEEIGTIDNMVQTGDSIVMTIRAKKVLGDVNLGDSIAVNGVCLTVTSYNPHQFTVDVMPETVRSTSLKELNRGSKVNLERAMSANGRFGGHFVSGHAEGIGEIVRRDPHYNAVYYEIKVPDELVKYIVLKGSIAVDGTSLTVFGVSESTFTISLIPHTLSETVLGGKGVGDIVNIECDMLAKYIENFMMRYLEHTDQTKTKSSITESFLSEHGFK